MVAFSFSAFEFATGQFGGVGELGGAFPGATGSFVVNERPFFDKAASLGGSVNDYVLTLTIPDGAVQSGNADDGNPQGDTGVENFISNSRAENFFLDTNGDGIPEYRIRGQNPNDLDVSNNTQEGDYLLKFNGVLRAYQLDSAGNETGSFIQLSSQNVYLSGDGDFPTNGTRIPTYDVNGSNNTFVYSNVAVPCFVAGTLIATPSGPRKIEALAVGDTVLTRDNGAQPIRWICATKVSVAQMERNPKLRPVHFPAGIFGNGQAISLSAQHKVLITSPRADLLFGESMVLVAAVALANLGGVTRPAHTPVQYVHILLDRHEIISANGIECESLNPAAFSGEAIPPDEAEELRALLGEQRPISSYPTLKGWEARALFA